MIKKKRVFPVITKVQFRYLETITSLGINLNSAFILNSYTIPGGKNNKYHTNKEIYRILGEIQECLPRRRDTV